MSELKVCPAKVEQYTANTGIPVEVNSASASFGFVTAAEAKVLCDPDCQGAATVFKQPGALRRLASVLRAGIELEKTRTTICPQAADVQDFLTIHSPGVVVLAEGETLARSSGGGDGWAYVSIQSNRSSEQAT